MKRAPAVAALLLVAGLAGACAGRAIAPGPPVHLTGGPSSEAASPPAPANGGPSGVVGRILMEGGPITPQYQQTPRPWPNKIMVAIDARGTVVATARSGSSGWFSLSLDPGVYRIRTADARPVRVVVHAGKVTRLTIEIPVP